MNRRHFLRLGCGLGTATAIGCIRTGIPDLLLGAREGGYDRIDGLKLLARFAHISDTHVMDEESPARFPGAYEITHSAWRPYESYTAQLLDGTIRTVNRIHASGHTINFLLHTGDACDNAQTNELDWFLRVMDGDFVDPLSGPDDRPLDARPETRLDPHAAFVAAGLYRGGVHGDRPSIPWYYVRGNHDRHAIGVFPIVNKADGGRAAPLPLPGRPGTWLPVELDPTASEAHGNVTPNEPGPPLLFEPARPVATNLERAFYTTGSVLESLGGTATPPAWHGLFDGRLWYSTSPVAGLRLIGLDTTDVVACPAGSVRSEGGVSANQMGFLRNALTRATDAGEVVIVATHHPSEALVPEIGSDVDARAFRATLSAFPNVVLHVAGHRHRNRVAQRDGYVEIETCSTLDLPQEGRLIEIWHDAVAGRVVVAYEMFSHRDDRWPSLGDDPLRELREQAYDIARGDPSAKARTQRIARTDAPAGVASDRVGRMKLPIPAGLE